MSPALEHVVKTCLAKDPERRWQSACDVVTELEWINTDAQTPLVGRSPIPWRRRPTLMVGILGLFAGGLVSATLFRSRRAQTPKSSMQVTRSAVPLPSDISLQVGTASSLVLSPDGSRLAFVAARGASRVADPELSAQGQLHLRSLEALDAEPIAGTEEACCPFFSPDGRSVGFFANGSLRKVAIGGGAPQTICEAGGLRGATWGPDDTIVFAPSITSGLFRVAAAGGTPQRLTTLDNEKREKSHRFPFYLPGGKAILFTIMSTDMTSFDQARVAQLSLDTGELRVLFEGGTQPKYLPTGHVLYVRGAEPRRSI